MATTQVKIGGGASALVEMKERTLSLLWGYAELAGAWLSGFLGRIRVNEVAIDGFVDEFCSVLDQRRLFRRIQPE